MTDDQLADAPREFEAHRGLLFSIAYRMLGSATDAEDVVQDAWLRYSSAPPQPIRSVRAYLGTIVTRLCLDRLKAARTTREQYVGPWLPEPMLHGDREPSLARAMEQRESISLAFLVLLESLTPQERAVFLLREVFDYDYRDIAEMLELSPVNCRQLFHRAKQRLIEQRPELGSRDIAPVTRAARAVRAGVHVGGLARRHARAAVAAAQRRRVPFGWRRQGDRGDAAGVRTRCGRALLPGDQEEGAKTPAVAAGRPVGERLHADARHGERRAGDLRWINGALDSVISLSASADGIFEIDLVRNPDKLAWLHARAGVGGWSKRASIRDAHGVAFARARLEREDAVAALRCHRHGASAAVGDRQTCPSSHS